MQHLRIPLLPDGQGWQLHGVMLDPNVKKETRVLIIDDDRCIREALTFVLESEGCKVLTAGNGAEGMEVLKKTHPDIVLLDGRMPIMNGWEMKRRMDADPQFSDVTVFAMSADGKNAPKMNADEYFPKPFDLDQFVNTLKPYLH